MRLHDYHLFPLSFPDNFVRPLPAAAWKIVKNMLPAKSHQLIKFVSKKDVTSLIPAACCLTRWGGDDDWTYSFDRAACAMPPNPFLGDQLDSAAPATDTAPLVNGETPAANGVANGHSGRKLHNGRKRSSLKSPQLNEYHNVKESPSVSSEAGPKVSNRQSLKARSDASEIRSLLPFKSKY